MLLDKVHFLSSLSTCKMCKDRTQLSHPDATLKVEYLFKMFDWHDVMVHDSQFSTPNSSVFLTPLRIIFILPTTSPIDTIISLKLKLSFTAQALNMESKVNCPGNSDMKVHGYDLSPVRRMVEKMINQRSIMEESSFEGYNQSVVRQKD